MFSLGGVYIQRDQVIQPTDFTVVAPPGDYDMSFVLAFPESSHENTTHGPWCFYTHSVEFESTTCTSMMWNPMPFGASAFIIALICLINFMAFFNGNSLIQMK